MFITKREVAHLESLRRSLMQPLPPDNDRDAISPEPFDPANQDRRTVDVEVQVADVAALLSVLKRMLPPDEPEGADHD